jgi:hypothetical protein
LVAQPVGERASLPPHRGRDIEVRLLERADPALAELDLSTSVVEYRLEQGALCFAAFQNGRIIACLWICVGAYDEDEVRCRFLPWPEGSTCWDFGMYIHPAHRGGIAFGRIWDEARVYLRQRGITWTVSRVGTVNIASIASHARLGARRLGTATYLRIGKAQLMISTLAPFVNLSLYANSKPLLRLTAPSGPTSSRR